MSADSVSSKSTLVETKSPDERRLSRMKNPIETEYRIRSLQKKWKGLLAAAVTAVGVAFAVDYQTTPEGEAAYPVRSGLVACALTLAYAKVWHLLSKARQKNREFSREHSFIFARALARIETEKIIANDAKEDPDDAEEGIPEVFAEIRKDYLGDAA